jgi:hypothetical protein
MAGASPKPRKSRQPARQSHPRPPVDKNSTAVVQAAVEGVGIPDGMVEFNGEQYKIAEKVGIWPIMQFARAAESGIGVGDYRALAALHGFLQDCIDTEDWGRFQNDMIEQKIDSADTLLDMATKVVEKVTSRPTQPLSASSNGQPAVSGGSTGASSSTAEEELAT